MRINEIEILLVDYQESAIKLLRAYMRKEINEEDMKRIMEAQVRLYAAKIRQSFTKGGKDATNTN